MSLTRNFRFDPPQHDSQGGADDLRLLESGKVEQPLQNFPVGIGEPDRGFVSQPQIVEMNGCAKSCNPSDSCGEGMALGTSERDLGALSAGASPLDWILQPEKKRTPSDRILAYLVQQEAHAETAPEKQHYRQCEITVALAAKGNPIPFIESSYICYGLHPDNVYSAILARRKALLGPTDDGSTRSDLVEGIRSQPGSAKKSVEYSSESGADILAQPSLQSVPVKKSPKSVTDARKSA